VIAGIPRLDAPMNPLKSFICSPIVAVICCSAMTATPAAEPEAYELTPSQMAARYLGENKWTELEALMLHLASSGERAEDGRHHLYLATGALGRSLRNWGEDYDKVIEAWIKDYHQKVPAAVFAPILEAIWLSSTAWRARGTGFASTVAPEGWRLFHSRNKKAWDVLQAAKARSSRLPSWYQWSINIGMDAEVSAAQVTAVFNEGIKKFPGFHALYFNYIRQFAPRWGGSYEEAAEFIEGQVASKTNPDGEVLYARLYWLMDQIEGGDVDFFRDSQVDWPRMRNGFELLMKQFPHSKWNQANFAMFACRARDAATYRKWRKGLTAPQFNEAAPEGLSLEVCEARFKTAA
jgi:hypothetical protein